MQTIYRISTILALLLLPFSSFAASYKGETSKKAAYSTISPSRTPKLSRIFLKDGPYLGLSGGYDSYKVQENIYLPAASRNPTSVMNPTINGTGLVGGLLAGYGVYFNNALYLAGEVFGNISSVYQNSNANIHEVSGTTSYSSKFIVTTGYGASILPGVKLNDAGLVYLRLGYHIARLRGQQNFTTSTTSFTSNSANWSGGFGYGIGFEEGMVENLSLRGDFVHIDYRSFNSSSNTEYQPSDNQFMISLVYHLVL